MTATEVPLAEAPPLGIRAEPGEGDTVLVWYENIATQLGLDPNDLTGPAITDPEPWPIPTHEEMLPPPQLWDTEPPLHQMILELAGQLCTDAVQIGDMLFQEQSLAWYLTQQAKEKEADNAPNNSETVAGDGPGRPAAAGGGSPTVPGGPQDGDPVGGGGKDPIQENVRRTPKVPRRRRPGQTENETGA